MSDAPASGVALVGPLDLPVGGVSSHVRRLADHLRARDIACTVIDPYPAPGKAAGPGHELTPVRSGAASLLWAAQRAWRSPHPSVHLHFSRVAGRFVPLALLLAASGKRLILSLHHGDQQRVYDRAGPLARWLTRLALGRMHRIVALSEEQRGFYERLGIRSERLMRWRAAPGRAGKPDSSLLPPALRQAARDGEQLLVTSGYPTPSYRYELSIALLERAAARFPCRLILCLYGEADESYLAALRERARGLPVEFADALPPAGFLALLQQADLYLRPSLIDSYGLAVSDALDLGVAALASDVCARDPRAAVFPAADQQAFLERGLQLLEDIRAGVAPATAAPTASGGHDEIVETYADAR